MTTMLWLRLVIALLAGSLLGIGVLLGFHKLIDVESIPEHNGMVHLVRRLELAVVALALIQAIAIVVGLMARFLDVQQIQANHESIQRNHEMILRAVGHP